MSDLTEHAKAELEKAGLLSEDSDYSGLAGKAVMELIELFASQGHSEGSASIVIPAFNALARYKLLTPLTGEDDEWEVVADTGLKQNKRCHTVFKNGEGECFDIDAYVIEAEDGSRYTGKDSHRLSSVTFPYTPPVHPTVVQECVAKQHALCGTRPGK